MKKFKFLLGILMVSAGAGLFSSCSDDDDVIPTVTISPEEKEYTVEVTTNVPATFEYNNASTEAVFTTTTGGILRVTPVDSKYVGQDVKIALGDNKNIKVNVTLIEKPSSNVKVDDANNSTEDIVVPGTTSGSSILIPGTTSIAGSDGDDNVGIGVYTASGTAEEPVVNKEVTSDVLVAVCEPDGAQFTEPVTITVSAPNADGLVFTCVNDAQGDAANVEVAANSLSAKVSHFSNWTFSLNATVINIAEEEETVLDTHILVHEGETSFLYSAWRGVETSETGVAKTFLFTQFGSEKSRVEKTGWLFSTGTGSAHVRVIQHKKVITYRSGSRTFTATVYGAVEVELVDITYDTTGHSGGIGG